MNKLAQEMETELTAHILPFWMEKAVDRENGGFYGYISSSLEVDAAHDKSGVLCARILWSFSRAYRMFGRREYLTAARRAYDYLRSYFWDAENGGIYWSVHYDGAPSQTKKQTYVQAFALYGVIEFFEASGDPSALALSEKLYRLIETHCLDSEYGGYIDALSGEWGALEDTSLSEKDMNVAKTMNTNLHVMEAYANFQRVSPRAETAESLRRLIEVMEKHILSDEEKSLQMYFDRDWTSRSQMRSYGHDIEGSWLLYEAAEILGDEALKKRMALLAEEIAAQVFENGIDRENGGLICEVDRGAVVSDEKEWWAQAEAVVGFFNAWQLSGKREYLDVSAQMWQFIQDNYITGLGEWYWGVSHDKKRHDNPELAGPWKCPYHNSRMCMKIIRRVKYSI